MLKPLNQGHSQDFSKGGHTVSKWDTLQAPVVQRLDNAIHRINRYPVDSMVCFVNTYRLDSDFSGG